MIENQRRPGASLALKLSHPALVTLLKKACSGENAAALAYIGHAGWLRPPVAKAAVEPIEADEWGIGRISGSCPRLRFQTIDLVDSAPSLATIA